MEVQNWSESILLILIFVLYFIKIKEPLGKSLLANDFNVKTDERNYIYSGSHPLAVCRQQLSLF